MSLSATAGWQRSWTMVNGQHLLRISGPWWFTCRRQKQQQQCAVRPPPSWACFVCRPNNWPYLWDILAFYVSIFPLALHTFLALWPGQVTTILVSPPSPSVLCGSIVLGLVFVAHELPSVSNFMLILWASKLVYCPLYGQTVCLSGHGQMPRPRRKTATGRKTEAKHLACARSEQRCGYLYVQVISYARSAASLRSSLVHLIIYLFYIYVFLGLTTVL